MTRFVWLLAALFLLGCQSTQQQKIGFTAAQDSRGAASERSGGGILTGMLKAVSRLAPVFDSLKPRAGKERAPPPVYWFDLPHGQLISIQLDKTIPNTLTGACNVIVSQYTSDGQRRWNFKRDSRHTVPIGSELGVNWGHQGVVLAEESPPAILTRCVSKDGNINGEIEIIRPQPLPMTAKT